MNERIRELAKSVQCERHWTEEDIEKFAELILEEVMQELFINGYEDAFDFLNKHFGVEE